MEKLSEILKIKRLDEAVLGTSNGDVLVKRYDKTTDEYVCEVLEYSDITGYWESTNDTIYCGLNELANARVY